VQRFFSPAPRSVPSAAKDMDALSHSMMTLAQRQAALDRVAGLLPGRTPATNRRPLNVPGRYSGWTLLDALCAWHPHLTPDEWLTRIDNGLVRQCGMLPLRGQSGACAEQSRPDGVRVRPGRIVREGERFEYLTAGQVEPDVNADIRVLHADDVLVVVSKPAPLPMHPCGQFHRNTLKGMLDTAWAPERLWAAHRLDASTSGVVVLARTADAARHVQQQFEKRAVQKTYLARVIGHPDADRFTCNVALSPRPRASQTNLVDPDGLSAATRFEVLERFPDGTALLKVEPLTGRTNQIRIHLWHLGLPIRGDRFFLTDGGTGSGRTQAVDDPALCLHAWHITLRHPADEHPVEFTAPPPDWVGPL